MARSRPALSSAGAAKLMQKRPVDFLDMDTAVIVSTASVSSSSLRAAAYRQSRSHRIVEYTGHRLINDPSNPQPDSTASHLADADPHRRQSRFHIGGRSWTGSTAGNRFSAVIPLSTIPRRSGQLQPPLTANAVPAAGQIFETSVLPLSTPGLPLAGSDLMLSGMSLTNEPADGIYRVRRSSFERASRPSSRTAPVNRPSILVSAELADGSAPRLTASRSTNEPLRKATSSQ
jgi:hypothetical protein